MAALKKGNGKRCPNYAVSSCVVEAGRQFEGWKEKSASSIGSARDCLWGKSTGKFKCCLTCTLFISRTTMTSQNKKHASGKHGSLLGNDSYSNQHFTVGGSCLVQLGYG